jgi:hypothetical protein
VAAVAMEIEGRAAGGRAAAAHLDVELCLCASRPERNFHWGIGTIEFLRRILRIFRPQHLCTILFALSPPGTLNGWINGLNFINNNYTHTPPDFRNTWRRHLRQRHRNKAKFIKLQAAIIRGLTTAYSSPHNNADMTSPFWWLLIHLKMLILAPTTKAQNEGKSIQQTISDRIDALEAGNIEYLYISVMKCNRHSQNANPTTLSHNQSAQKAADSDQMSIAVSRANTIQTIATINEHNIQTVQDLYPPPTNHPGHQPIPPQPQQYHLPGHICDTIKNTVKNIATGLNADSTDAIIDLVNANIPGTNDDLQFLFNQIFLNNVPQPIRHYFSDVYLFCLHKDPNNLANLRPLGIPTAIRRLMARHVAQTFKAKFAEFLLPYNFAVGIANGSDIIINTMHLTIEKYITNYELNNKTPTRAAVFFDIKNMFNSISRIEFFNVIETSFPELLPLTKLLYDDPGTVHHKWTDNTWHTLLMDEGSTQGCPLSPIFGALVVARLLKPIDTTLRARAAERLAAGNPHDDNCGGITNLLAFMDDISTVTPLEDLLYLCQQMDTKGRPLGCLLNTYKTRILASTTGTSPIHLITSTHPDLGKSITTAITTYSNKRNKSNPLHPIPVELTQGYRLL